MAHVTSMNYSFGDCWLFRIAADFWWGLRQTQSNQIYEQSSDEPEMKSQQSAFKLTIRRFIGSFNSLETVMQVVQVVLDQHSIPSVLSVAFDHRQEESSVPPRCHVLANVVGLWDLLEKHVALVQSDDLHLFNPRSLDLLVAQGNYFESETKCLRSLTEVENYPMLTSLPRVRRTCGKEPFKFYKSWLKVPNEFLQENDEFCEGFAHQLGLTEIYWDEGRSHRVTDKIPYSRILRTKRNCDVQVMNFLVQSQNQVESRIVLQVEMWLIQFNAFDGMASILPS